MSKPAPKTMDELNAKIDELNTKFIALEVKNDVGLSKEMLAFFNEEIGFAYEVLSPSILGSGSYEVIEVKSDKFSPCSLRGKSQPCYFSDILKQNFLNFLREELDRSKGESSTDEPKFNWDKIAKNLFGLAKKFAVGDMRIKDLKLAKELLDLTKRIKNERAVEPENFESECKVFDRLYEFEKDELALLFFLPNEKVLKEKGSGKKYIDFIKDGLQQESFLDQYLGFKTVVYEVLEDKEPKDMTKYGNARSKIMDLHLDHIHEVATYHYFAALHSDPKYLRDNTSPKAYTDPLERSEHSSFLNYSFNIFGGRFEDPSEKKDIAAMLTIAVAPLAYNFDRKKHPEAFKKASIFATQAFVAATANSESASVEVVAAIEGLIDRIGNAKKKGSSKSSTTTEHSDEGNEPSASFKPWRSKGWARDETQPLLPKKKETARRL